jgi:hypothetical protein
MIFVGHTGRMTALLKKYFFLAPSVTKIAFARERYAALQ